MPAPPSGDPQLTAVNETSHAHEDKPVVNGDENPAIRKKIQPADSENCVTNDFSNETVEKCNIACSDADVTSELAEDEAVTKERIIENGNSHASDQNHEILQKESENEDDKTVMDKTEDRGRDKDVSVAAEKHDEAVAHNKQENAVDCDPLSVNENVTVSKTAISIEDAVKHVDGEHLSSDTTEVKTTESNTDSDVVNGTKEICDEKPSSLEKEGVQSSNVDLTGNCIENQQSEDHSNHGNCSGGKSRGNESAEGQESTFGIRKDDELKDGEMKGNAETTDVVIQNTAATAVVTASDGQKHTVDEPVDTGETRIDSVLPDVTSKDNKLVNEEFYDCSSEILANNEQTENPDVTIHKKQLDLGDIEIMDGPESHSENLEAPTCTKQSDSIPEAEPCRKTSETETCQSENHEATVTVQSENCDAIQSEATEFKKSEILAVTGSEQCKNQGQVCECEHSQIAPDLVQSEYTEKALECTHSETLGIARSKQSESLEMPESKQSEHFDAAEETERLVNLETVSDPEQSKHLPGAVESESSECLEKGLPASKTAQTRLITGEYKQSETFNTTSDSNWCGNVETTPEPEQHGHLETPTESACLQTNTEYRQCDHLKGTDEFHQREIHEVMKADSEQTENILTTIESEQLKHAELTESRQVENSEKTHQSGHAGDCKQVEIMIESSSQSENSKITTDLRNSEILGETCESNEVPHVHHVHPDEGTSDCRKPKNLATLVEMEKFDQYEQINSNAGAEIEQAENDGISEKCVEQIHDNMKLLMVDKETQILDSENVETKPTAKLSECTDSVEPGSVSHEIAKDGSEKIPENAPQTGVQDKVQTSDLCNKMAKMVQLLENVIVKPVSVDVSIQTDNISLPEVCDKSTATPESSEMQMVSVSTGTPVPEPLRKDSVDSQTIPDVRPKTTEAQTQTPPLKTRAAEDPGIELCAAHAAASPKNPHISALLAAAAAKNGGIDSDTDESLCTRITESIFEDTTDEEEDDEAATAHMQYKVDVLKNGYSFVEDSGNMKADCTITLVTGKHKVLVDTGSPWDRDYLIKALQERGLKPSHINYVVCSHGHLDHVGNLNLFQNATFIVNFDISNHDTYILHEMDQGKPYIIDEDLAVIATPGHSVDDISLVVSNTELGIIVIAGDLFENEDDQTDPSLWKDNSSNPELQEKNRQKVLRMADYIVPGHGKMFKVSTRPQ